MSDDCFRDLEWTEGTIRRRNVRSVAGDCVGPLPLLARTSILFAGEHEKVPTSNLDGLRDSIWANLASSDKGLHVPTAKVLRNRMPFGV
jgi:hypothetical protein